MADSKQLGQILINIDETSAYLAKILFAKMILKKDVNWRYFTKQTRRFQFSSLTKDEYLELLEPTIARDLNEWQRETKALYKKTYRKLVSFVIENFDKTVFALYGETNKEIINTLLTTAMKHDQNFQGIVSSVGSTLLPEASWIMHNVAANVESPTVIRNILNNEALLKIKMTKNLPFWFIDSGYTNFLHTSKMWHRVVYNHIHHGMLSDNFPADRLSMFTTFPKPWRTSGNDILVIEPSRYTCDLFNFKLNTWKQEIKDALAQHTDRKIKFRSKSSKKLRNNLYEYLLESDYYCVINYASGSAIESIWAGIPTITLGKHVSNAITGNSCSQINNLYRGPIGNWLCALSYSQFNFAQLKDGTARSIAKDYHYV